MNFSVFFVMQISACIWNYVNNTGCAPPHFTCQWNCCALLCAVTRGSVRSTQGLGPTMTARGQSIGVSIGMLPQTLIMSITVQKTCKYYTTEFDLEEGFLNGACIGISNLPENIAWQTHRPEARGPVKSGAWDSRPTCHPQTPPLAVTFLPFYSHHFRS